jgi:hypothetical protein
LCFVETVPWEQRSGSHLVWVAPTVRGFIRENKLQSGFLFFFCQWFTVLLWASWDALPLAIGILIGVLSGSLAWLALMFGHSRGMHEGGE